MPALSEKAAHRIVHSCLACLACLALLVGGCAKHDEAPPPEPSKPEDFGQLRGLRAVPDARLRDELARIVEEGGTPELLAKNVVAEADNAAAGLQGLFAEKEVKSILRESEQIFPSGRFELDPTRLHNAIDFRTKYDAQRLRARDALARPKCDFAIQFMEGSLAKMEFLDVAWICARLEAFRAAESLSADASHPGRTDEAVESLGRMLRLAACLAAEKSAVARLEGAYVRTEAFGVLQAMVRDDRVAEEHLDPLYEMVQRHLKDWPNDADAWIGERAMGMHAYEMVRAGYVMDLLTAEELDRFGKEGILKELGVAASRNVNQDELFYLETMRKIIGSCARPYHARVPLFDSIGKELQQKRNSAEDPIVAALLLLPKIQKGHAVQAQDRANWEAWALALAMATGRELPPYRKNPVSGEEYRPAKRDKFVEVGNFSSGNGNASIMVPLVAEKAKESAL